MLFEILDSHSGECGDCSPL